MASCGLLSVCVIIVLSLSQVRSTHISNVKRSKPSSDNVLSSIDQKKKRHEEKASFHTERSNCIEVFGSWQSHEQLDFLCHVLCHMSHFQQSQINNMLDPLLRRDFITGFQSMFSLLRNAKTNPLYQFLTGCLTGG